MTATADTSTTVPAEDEDATGAPAAPEPGEKKPESVAKPRTKPHTDVPAPLAGPARRTALALGVPSFGLAELLVHANFGWTGVAAFTTAAAVGAGVVYAVRRQQREAKATTKGADSKVGASKTPSSLASKLRAKPIGRSSTRGDTATGRSSAARGGLAGRLMSRLGGRGGADGGSGRGGGLGGRARGVAGRSGVRSGLGTTGRTGGRASRTGRTMSSPGARAAAAKAKHLTGGRPSKTTAGLRSLANRSHHRKAGRAGSGVGLGGGSFFGGNASRRTSPARASRSRRGAHQDFRASGRKGRTAVTVPPRHRRVRVLPRLRRACNLGVFAATAGRYMLKPLLGSAVVAGAVLAGAALVSASLVVGAAYGSFRLATSRRVRYGAAVIAGWMRLGISRAYQWARAQWWKSRGKTTAADVYIAEGETVDETHVPTAPPSPPPPPVYDAEIVPEPAPSPTPMRELTVTPRQPKLAHTPPAPAGSASPRHQEISIVSALNDITAGIAAAPAFTPTSGHDAEEYMDSIVTLLDTLGGRVSSDLQTIAENLPQEAAALGTLSSLGEVLTAFATQAGEQVEVWKQTANWVWKQG